MVEPTSDYTTHPRTKIIPNIGKFIR